MRLIDVEQQQRQRILNALITLLQFLKSFRKVSLDIVGSLRGQDFQLALHI